LENWIKKDIKTTQGYMMKKRKGIILAGGLGTRLYPLTIPVSKQLLPIYDKPLIYYPLTVLMLAEINDILIITNSCDQEQFKKLLGNGNQWGINLEYVIQPKPDGIAQAFIISEKFLNGSPSALVLGDNLFFGNGLANLLLLASKQIEGATIFGYHVKNPEDYGVMEFRVDGTLKTIMEKPKVPQSNYAVTGLYFVDSSAPQRAKIIKPSYRGELEITSFLETYLSDRLLEVKKMGNGYAWLDTGTHSSMLDAANFVRTLTERQGLQIGSPDQVAFEYGWINKLQLEERAKLFKNSTYGDYLNKLLI
jgi:glucose-1-phosphate thymidylyltransferase